MTPERLTPDPAVAVAAYRFPSRSAPGRTYDTALLIGDGIATHPTYWDCTCWPFLKVDKCQHVAIAARELRLEEAREARQAARDARLGCLHPLTVDELCDLGTGRLLRVCLGCGLRYDRSPPMASLEADIRARRRLPASPWSASERASDTE